MLRPEWTVSCGVVSTRDLTENRLVPAGRTGFVMVMSFSDPAERVGWRGALPVVVELSSDLSCSVGDTVVRSGARLAWGMRGVFNAPM